MDWLKRSGRNLDELNEGSWANGRQEKHWFLLPSLLSSELC